MQLLCHEVNEELKHDSFVLPAAVTLNLHQQTEETDHVRGHVKQ